MDLREIATVKIQVVLLLAVIGQGMARHLTPGDAPPVGEHGQEQRVDVRALLENIEHGLHAFIDERDGADLNADHLLAGLRLRRGGGQRTGCQPGGGGFQKVASG